jgi:hypothetical protein
VSHRPPVALFITGIAVVVGTFLPWLRSGARWRTSYELLGLVDRLGAARGPGASLLRWWPIVPLLVTASVVVAWWGFRRAAVVLAVMVCAAAIHVSVVVERGAGRAAMRTGAGLWLTAYASVALVLASIWWVVRASLRSRVAESDSVRSAHADSR